MSLLAHVFDILAFKGVIVLSYGIIRVLAVKFSELVRLLERNGFELIKEKGSVRYYCKEGLNRLIRVDYHGSREIPKGTCEAILKAAGLKQKEV